MNCDKSTKIRRGTRREALISQTKRICLQLKPFKQFQWQLTGLITTLIIISLINKIDAEPFRSRSSSRSSSSLSRSSSSINNDSTMIDSDENNTILGPEDISFSARTPRYGREKVRRRLNELKDWSSKNVEGISTLRSQKIQQTRRRKRNILSRLRRLLNGGFRNAQSIVVNGSGRFVDLVGDVIEDRQQRKEKERQFDESDSDEDDSLD